LPSIPVFIDSRWTPWYKGMRVIVDNWTVFVANEVLTRAQTDTVAEAEALLAPWHLHTQLCERDNSTVFDAIVAYAELVPVSYEANGPATIEKFQRNFVKLPLVAGIALMPSLVVEALTSVEKFLLRAALEEGLKHFWFETSGFCWFTLGR
jgi:hypothetical protein